MRRPLYLLGFVLLMSSSICFSFITCKSTGNPSSPNPFIATATFTITPTSTNSPCGFPSDTCTSTWTYTPTPTNTYVPTPTGTATPGYTWYESTSAAAFGKRGFHSSVVFDNKMWVIGGTDSFDPSNDVWSSSDGTNWNPATTNALFSPRYYSAAVTFDDGSGSKIWLIGGNIGSITGVNDVWKSADGIVWSAATTAAGFVSRFNHTSVVFGSPASIWVIGGQSSTVTSYNDIWSSPDGATWNQVNAAASFSPRNMHASVVYNGNIWVIGGEDCCSMFNDVWASSDGIAWTQILANEPASSTHFSARVGHSCAVYDGAMWVIGGWDFSMKNDVWTSMNGVTWTQVLSAAPFQVREGHSCLAYQSSLWVIGGLYLPFGEVWRSP